MSSPQTPEYGIVDLYAYEELSPENTQEVSEDKDLGTRIRTINLEDPDETIILFEEVCDDISILPDYSNWWQFPIQDFDVEVLISDCPGVNVYTVMQRMDPLWEKGIYSEDQLQKWFSKLMVLTIKFVCGLSSHNLSPRMFADIATVTLYNYDAYHGFTKILKNCGIQKSGRSFRFLMYPHVLKRLMFNDLNIKSLVRRRKNKNIY